MNDEQKAAPDPKKLLRPPLTAESPEANGGVELPKATPLIFRDVEVAGMLDAAAKSGRWLIAISWLFEGKITTVRKTNDFPVADVPIAVADLMNGQARKLKGATDNEKLLRQIELYSDTILRLEKRLAELKMTLSEGGK